MKKEMEGGTKRGEGVREKRRWGRRSAAVSFIGWREKKNKSILDRKEAMH